MNTTVEIFEGDGLSQNVAPVTGEFILQGKTAAGQPACLSISNELLSKHFLIIGSIGTGKTNTFMALLNQIKRKMTNNDVMIIFDTKGDYYKAFFDKTRDIMVGAEQTPDKDSLWNIYKEITADDRILENIIEISRTLFFDKIANSTQPFFPNAAKDLFAGLLEATINADNPNNAKLKDLISNCDVTMLQNIFAKANLRSLNSYISKADSPQTQGVLSEMQQLVTEIFISNFAKSGNFSIREFMKNKGGRTLFIEYDLSIGNMLTPIYRLFYDLAIKEALGRKKTDGNVYFIVDEFSLIPHLQHIADGVNFGRSLGAKFIVGLQNIDQMFEAYGESSAKSILSGFSSVIAFRLNDAATREYLKGAWGKNKKKYTYMSKVGSRGIIEEVRDANVVEDWDIQRLGLGEAIVSIPEHYPFLFKFNEYR